MAAAIVIVAAFVVLGVAAVVSMRRRGAEVHDVEQHHRALSTLERFAQERGVQADRRVGLPRSQQLRSPHASDDVPPVRLDLGRLADLTDPDMIRIDADVQARLAAGEDPATILDEQRRAREQAQAQEPARAKGEGAQGARPEMAEPQPTAPDVLGVPIRDERDGAAGERADEVVVSRAASGSAAPSADATAVRGAPGGVGAGASEETAVLEGVGAVPPPGLAARGAAGREHRIYSLRRRTRLPVVLGAAGVAALAIGVLAFELSQGASSQRPSPSRPSGSTGSKTATSAGKPSSNAKHSSSAATPAVAEVTSSSQGATYRVAGGVHSVVLQVGAAPCWVADAQAPGGQILWDETLPAGSSYTITWSGGPLWLRAGNSGVLTLSVNGYPVRFSAPPGPYDFTFEPASAP